MTSHHEIAILLLRRFKELIHEAQKNKPPELTVQREEFVDYWSSFHPTHSAGNKGNLLKRMRKINEEKALKQIHKKLFEQTYPGFNGKHRRYGALVIGAAITILTLGVLLFYRSAIPGQPAGQPDATDEFAPASLKTTVGIAFVTGDGAHAHIYAGKEGQYSLNGIAIIGQAENMFQINRGTLSGIHGNLRVSNGTRVQCRLLLEDGCFIWLDAGSSVRLPCLGTSGEQAIELTGRAFIEPGNDHTRAVDIRIPLASASIRFRAGSLVVDASPDSAGVHAVAIGDTAKISYGCGNILLEPAVNLALTLDSCAVATSPANTQSLLSWTTPVFSFEDTPLTVVLASIGRWYGVNFEVSRSVDDYLIDAGLSKSRSLNDILRLLESGGRIHFKRTAARTWQVS